MWLFNICLSVLLLMLGASLASFWAVVSYRSKKKISWVKGRSFCESCQKKIKWFDNIPIVSYIILKGKCRNCKIIIPPNYFWWELLFGVWLVSWFWWSVAGELMNLTNWSWINCVENLLLLMVGVVLLWTALEDIRTQKIVNLWLWVLGFLTLGRMILLSWQDEIIIWQIVNNVILSGLVFGGYYALNKLSQWWWKKQGLGSGDMWMFLILLWWLSPKQLLVMFLFSFWLGAIVGIFLLLKQKNLKKHRLAFLPFVNLAFMMAYYGGEQMFNWWFRY